MCFCDVNGIDVHCGLLYDDARAKVCSGTLILNLFGGFIVASIINPYEVQAEEDIIEVQEGEKQTFLKC